MAVAIESQLNKLKVLLKKKKRRKKNHGTQRNQEKYLINL
jgi:ribosome-associated translation inhibitor RaiA